MRIFRNLKQMTSVYLIKSQSSKVQARQYVTMLINKPHAFRNRVETLSLICAYSSENKKQFLNLDKKADAFKDVLEHKKEQLKDTEHRIRQTGENLIKDLRHQKQVTGQILREKKEHIVKDILETKAKVKERIEGVVERENVLTIPNILCVTRIAMSPYLGYVILQDQYHLALALLVFAGITDLNASKRSSRTERGSSTHQYKQLSRWGQLNNFHANLHLDGWIARTWKSQSTKMGSFLDPMADKVLIATLFVTLTWQNLIPLYLTLLIVARDVALVAAGFVIRYMSLPPPRTLSRYFDVTHATAQLEPTLVSKINTAIQLTLVGTALASPVFGYVDHPAMDALCVLTAASTVAAAVSYLVSKDTYRILKKKS